MADPSALAGLLDRAGHVFHLAWQLGRTFQEEHGTGGGFRQVDPTSWARNQPAFNEFCAAILDLRDAMQNPPEGFGPVAQALMKAAGVAKQIRDRMQTADGQTWAAFLDFFPELNSVAATGHEAIKDVTKPRQADDPFAFVGQAAARKKTGIDTTPTLPRPPQSLIEAAAREIPGILANVQPKQDGTIELIASHLVTKLHDAKHTLAAAQWAIHEAVKDRRLEAGRVEVYLPTYGREVGRRAMFGAPDTRHMEWTGGGKSTIAIPEGRPAPFDTFNVVATESFWAWWRTFDAGSSATDQSSDVPLDRSTMAAGQAMLAHIDSLATTNTTMRSLVVDLGARHAGVAAPTDASLALMRVFTNGIVDDRIEKATRLLADDKLTANEKLTKIDALIPFPATASAEQLGELLGVTKQAVLKTEWWMQNRKGEKENEVGRRREGHRKRAKSYEAPGQDDEDE
jgi:hypothetical protein